jgi:sugar lactone lactonase YvrE
MKTKLLRLLLVLLLGLGLSAPLASTASAHHRFPDRIELPDGFRPEGITIGSKPTAYLGSLANGDIFAADLRTGSGRVISEGPGPGNPSVGLKTDGRGLLYVAGGSAGSGRVISIKTGEILASYQFATAPTFVNDVVLTKRTAWFTDSAQPEASVRPKLYGVPLARHGKPAGADQVRTLTLSGEWPVGTTGGNGISQTPDRRALLVIQAGTGLLFRVNPSTGVAKLVDVDGGPLTAGDGLLLRGRTLYVVRNRLNQVAVVKLNRAGTEGRVVQTVTSPDFDVPTTVASFGHSLYLPNARFGIPSPETAEYWITRIPRP